MAQSELLGDHAAERDAVHVSGFDLRRIEHGRGVVGHGLGRVGVGGRLRATDAAVVEGDHPEAARQDRELSATTRRRSTRAP